MRARTLFSMLATVGLIAGGAAQAMLDNVDALVVNEIYYDGSGADVGMFTEILGPPGMAMDGYSLVGVNGSDGGDYMTVSLDGMVIPADGYLVVGQDATVPNVDYIRTGVDWQNGPDEVELRQGSVVIDGICYGSAALLNCEGGTNGPDVAAGRSISRCPNGRDTDNNANDTADTTPSAGVTNNCPVLPVDMTLCEAVRLDANASPVHLGELVHITADLLVLCDDDTYSLTNLDVEATDGECCVNVFDFNIDPVLAVGDMIDVTGTIALYNGKVEISGPGIVVTLVSSGHPLPDPEEITTEELATHGNDYESCLISICGLTIVGGDPWPASGSNANVTVRDDSGVDVTLRVDKETDIDGSAPPAEPFTCIGLAGQFDSSPPYTEGFQIAPRGLFDILSGVDCLAPAACCVGEDCFLVFAEDCADMQGVFHPEWESCGPPNPCQIAKACCVGEECLFITQDECDAMQGVFHPEWESCGPPNPCQVAKACCVGEDCFFVTMDECEGMQGVFHPEWESCGPPNPCLVPKVCCVGHDCYLMTEEECAGAQGVYHAEWDSCGPPNPCEPPSPAQPDTWGGVKNLFR